MNRLLTRPWIVPVFVGLVALVPRWQWAVMSHPRLFSDPEDYHHCAVGLLDGRGMVQEEKYRAYRPPLYPLFLASVYAVGGPDEDHAYLVQAVLGALSCALFAYFLQRLFVPSTKHENTSNVVEAVPSPKLGGGLGRGLKGLFLGHIRFASAHSLPFHSTFPGDNRKPWETHAIDETIPSPEPSDLGSQNVFARPLPHTWGRQGGGDIEKCGWLSILPLLGGLAFAFSRDQIFFIGTIMSETLFVFLLVLWLITLIEWRERRSWGWIAGMGFLQGLMTLCRPVALGYLPVAMAMLWMNRDLPANPPDKLNHSRGLRLLLMLCFVALPLIPWTVRNAIVLGRYVPVATNGGVNFYIGHHAGYSYWSTGDKEAIRQAAGLNEVDESALFFQLGMEYIRANPRRTVTDSLLKLLYLFTTQIPPWPWGERGTEVGFERLAWFTWIRWSPVWAVLAWGGMALCFLKVNAKFRFLAGIVACHVTMTILFFARSRFRVPLDPLFLTTALIALRSIGSIVANQWQGRAASHEK